MNKTKKFIAYSLILFLWIFLLEAISFTTLYVIQNKYNSLYFDYSKINIKPDLSNQNYSENLVGYHLKKILMNLELVLMMVAISLVV